MEEGDEVVQNQILVVIENDSLRGRLVSLRKELSVISQETRQNYLTNDVLLLQANLGEKRRLEAELKEIDKELEEMKRGN